MNKISFKTNLKQLRQANALSQSKLAQELNVSLKTISHWETGYSEPSLTQLAMIADYFDITIDDLIRSES